MEPEQASQSIGLAKLDAQILKPSNTEVTCHAGSGSLIDYAVVSNSLEPYVVSLTSVTDVPWGPHDGLRLVLKADPRQVKIRTLDKPKSFATLGEETRVPRTTWSQAKSYLRENKFEQEKRKGTHGQHGNADDSRGSCHSAEALRLGDLYEQWAATLEAQMIANHEIPLTEQTRFAGRAKSIRMKTRPFLRKPRLHTGTYQVIGGVGIVGRLWHTLAAMMRKLNVAIKAKDARRHAAARLIIVDVLVADTSDLRAAWAAVPCCADQAAAGHAILLACKANASVEDVDAAIAIMYRLAEKKLKVQF